jgi:hypothetical protein
LVSPEQRPAHQSAAQRPQHGALGCGRRRFHRPCRGTPAGAELPDEQIVLLEAQEVGFGSSGRNAGFAIDLPHDIGADDYIGDIGVARTTLKLNLSGQSFSRNWWSATRSIAR